MIKTKNSNETVKMICVDNILSFSENPYKVIDNEEMDELVKSIEERGILSPLVLRGFEDDPNRFELISGHRRLFAAKKIGLSSVPASVHFISRDEAAIMVVDSNLHREHILPSEKAKAYKLKYDAMKHQGTSCQVGTKLRTDEIVAENTNDSARQVQRYIRLNNLIPEFLDMLDEGRIAFSVGVEISYLDMDMQCILTDLIEELDHTPSYAQANRMHKDFIAGTLTEESMKDMLSVDKPNQKPVYRFQAEKFSKYFKPETAQKDAEDFIIKACEYYSKYLMRKRDKDAR